MRVYNWLQIRRWHLISCFYILPTIYRCKICKLYKCEICKLLSLPFFWKKFNLLIQMCTFEHSCTQCYHGNNKCEIWNTFMCCIKIITMKNTTHYKMNAARYAYEVSFCNVYFHFKHQINIDFLDSSLGIIHQLFLIPFLFSYCSWLTTLSAVAV